MSTSDVDIESLHLTPELGKMVEGFANTANEKIRYKNLMYLANQLAPVEDDIRIDANKVPGCLSTVHVTCQLNDDLSTVSFRGDSDGILTKGLLALLVRGLDGCTPEEIEKVDPKFIHVAGIAQTLTPGRNNGFLNMIAVMKRKAREVVCSDDDDISTNDDITTDTAAPSSSIITTFEERPNAPMYNAILSTLISTLKPTSIELIDNSDQHAESKGFDGESHFALSITAEAFESMSLPQRNQMIYLLLGDVMSKIHALEISSAKSVGEE